MAEPLEVVQQRALHLRAVDRPCLDGLQEVLSMRQEFRLSLHCWVSRINQD